MREENILIKEEIAKFKNNDFITMTFGEFSILQKIGRLDFNHPTQRNGVWDLEQANKMIESIFQSFPFEPIYLVKNKDRYWVIDGKQRLTTMLLFCGYLPKELGIELKKSVKGQIKENFELGEEYIDSDLWSSLNKLRSKESEKVNYKFLVDKVPNFNKHYIEVTFPVYVLFSESNEESREENAYELFRKLNSSGTQIESGEKLKGMIYERFSGKKLWNTEKIKNIVNLYKKTIMPKGKVKTKRDKEWFFFARTIWNLANFKKLISGNCDSCNMEQEIEDFVMTWEENKFMDYLKKMKEYCEHINKAKEQFCNSNNEKSIFNKNGKQGSPLNMFLSAIYVGVYRATTQKEIDKTEVIKRVVASVKILRSISDNDNAEYKFDYISQNEEANAKKHLIKKFSREPQKFKLYSFLGSLIIGDGVLDETTIRIKIYEKFFKGEANWNFPEKEFKRISVV